MSKHTCVTKHCLLSYQPKLSTKKRLSSFTFKTAHDTFNSNEKKTEESSKKRMPLPDDIDEEYDTSDACKRWNSSNNST